MESIWDACSPNKVLYSLFFATSIGVPEQQTCPFKQTT
jgi:hypothetical protein